VFHRNGVSRGGANEATVRFVGRKPGRVAVKLTTKITRAVSGEGQYQLDGDRVFEHSLEIQVFDSLTLRSPLLPANSLLLPPLAEHQLVHSREAGAKETRYTGIQGEVSVTNSGIVRADRSTGRSVILVEAVEDFGVVQTLSVVVEVKPVHYVMINFQEAFSPSSASPLRQVPRGIKLNAYVSLHDNTGARFAPARRGAFADPRLRPSRFDSLALSEMGNGTFAVEVHREELTVLRAADESLGLDVRHWPYVMLFNKASLRILWCLTLARASFPLLSPRV